MNNPQRSFNMNWDKDFENIEYFASGNFCDVFTAVHQGSQVCLKIPRDDIESFDDSCEQIEHELNVFKIMTHPNCMQLIGAGHKMHPQLGKVRFIVLEFVSGGTWKQKVDLGQKKSMLGCGEYKLTYIERLYLCVQLASALKYLHNDYKPGMALVHRDLKPQNVCFTGAGDVKLMDFGLAQLIEPSGEEHKVYAMSGETGTLRYMAPEVALSLPYNEKTDVYGFALLAWQMLSLTTPYEGITPNTFERYVVERNMRPKCPSKWGDELCQLLESCWQADMHARPAFTHVLNKMNEIYNAQKEAPPRRRSLSAIFTSKSEIPPPSLQKPLDTDNQINIQNLESQMANNSIAP
eukprot:CAMPEP_0117778702 /NCGR_PEP_ID=MMETSP0948-20121206/1154_1 /TAXON_ID=44440 /ORGANISM="Chattonella subsalsa, Strain CCMP2191" /LENGTH=349 /DNA_ID=CAMNT_0005606085 /DNA_START=133 /DNA_END=1182 /DNA_ORIENTATION=+